MPTPSPTVTSSLEAQEIRLIVSFYKQLSTKPAAESPIDGLLLSCLDWEKKGKQKKKESLEIFFCL